MCEGRVSYLLRQPNRFTGTVRMKASGSTLRMWHMHPRTAPGRRAGSDCTWGGPWIPGQATWLSWHTPHLQEVPFQTLDGS